MPGQEESWDAMAQQATGDESAVLRSSLDSQRLHVLGILEGLPDEALRRPVLPSGWTCVGLVTSVRAVVIPTGPGSVRPVAAAGSAEGTLPGKLTG
jgi:hypothetical protein